MAYSTQAHHQTGAADTGNGVAADLLLTDDDPAPVEQINADSGAPLVLLCEHAGQAFPSKLGKLGLSNDVINSHRGWDIGAEQLARRIAATLNAPLILQRYSRLVVDCNRPPKSKSFIIDCSDGAIVPGNNGLSAADRAARTAAIFQPMERGLQDSFNASPRRAAFSIHSFTPRMNGQSRPWHAGFLSRSDLRTATSLRDYIKAVAPGLSLAINEPYQIESDGDWFIPAHAEQRGLAHALIEVRNDELLTEQGIARWSDLLSRAITHVLEQIS